MSIPSRHHPYRRYQYMLRARIVCLQRPLRKRVPPSPPPAFELDSPAIIFAVCMPPPSSTTSSCSCTPIKYSSAYWCAITAMNMFRAFHPPQNDLRHSHRSPGQRIQRPSPPLFPSHFCYQLHIPFGASLNWLHIANNVGCCSANFGATLASVL